MKLKSHINTIIQDAFKKAGINETPLSVTEATKVTFGDYQFNGAMALAKKLKKNPREIATTIVKHIDLNGAIKKAEIAGAGFINLWLNPSWVASQAKQIQQDERLGIQKSSNPQTIVVDYSGPNMAKQMHVGHLRSTIIGDTLCNLFRFLGENVIPQNHIGDWGTQFGMLIAYLELTKEEGDVNLNDLETFYKEAKATFDADEAFAKVARAYVVKIQSGDERCLGLWKKFIDISLGHCEEVYKKLNINLSRDDVKAESFYNDMLSDIVDELTQLDKIQMSNGAKCVFLEAEENPIIIQKSDGGYLYATTDLAALKYRAQTLQANRVCYVVDARQSEHFKQLFRLSKEANFVPQDVALEHIAFGTMMDRGGKPFKTRDGGTIKLIDLLDEAVRSAKETLREKELYTQEELDNRAKVIGIGAVKYADLSLNRESNYIFDKEKMLSKVGNTSVYMQYAYARIQSIFKNYHQTLQGEILIQDALEHRLSVMLLRFEDILTKSAKDASLNHITTYLFELATLFSQFYEQNPILKEGVKEELKVSRLLLADLTAKTIKKGLNILGIEVLSRL